MQYFDSHEFPYAIPIKLVYSILKYMISMALIINWLAELYLWGHFFFSTTQFCVRNRKSILLTFVRGGDNCSSVQCFIKC